MPKIVCTSLFSSKYFPEIRKQSPAYERLENSDTDMKKDTDKSKGNLPCAENFECVIVILAEMVIDCKKTGKNRLSRTKTGKISGFSFLCSA